MNTRKIFGYGTIAVMLLMAFTALSLTGCENDPPIIPPTIIPQTVTYISEDNNGNLYTLVITENTGRAVYSPKNGDSFTFTVELFNNGTYSLALTCSGTVDSTEKDGTEIKITVNGEELTITVSGTTMTVISGKIVNEDDEVVVETPGGLTQVTDKTALEKVLNAAKGAKEAVVVSADGADVLTTVYWVTQAQMDSFASAIATAQAFYDAEDADQSMITSARIALAAAITVFNGQKQPGTKPDDSGTADPALSGTISVSPSTGVTINTELTATYTGSEAVSYQWKKDGGNVGTNSNKHTPTAAGSYTVTVSATGYQSKTSVAVTVIDITTPTEGLAYELINNGTAYRVRKGTVTGGAVVIPATYNNLPVTEIGSADDEHIEGGAFYNTSITSVTIPDSVTSIGRSAFLINQLTSVTIPNSVTEIGGGAFSNNQLTSVTIGNSVTSIGFAAFSGNQLTSVTIPNSVTIIDFGAFIGNKLTSVTIGNSVTSIEGFAFYGNQMTSVTIPNSVTSIGGNAFGGNQLTSVVIGNSVTSIGDYAFAENPLTSVTIPNSITSIGDYAFVNNQLTSITIGASVMLRPGVFTIDYSFDIAYQQANWAAGTYTRTDTIAVWTRQE